MTMARVEKLLTELTPDELRRLINKARALLVLGGNPNNKTTKHEDWILADIVGYLERKTGELTSLERLVNSKDYPAFKDKREKLDQYLTRHMRDPKDREKTVPRIEKRALLRLCIDELFKELTTGPMRINSKTGEKFKGSPTEVNARHLMRSGSSGASPGHHAAYISTAYPASC
jgi:hypothetical protein